MILPLTSCNALLSSKATNTDIIVDHVKELMELDILNQLGNLTRRARCDKSALLTVANNLPQGEYIRSLITNTPEKDFNLLNIQREIDTRIEQISKINE